MKKILTYIAGAKPSYCEDALYADERCAFVLDGATGVSGEKVNFAGAEKVADKPSAVLSVVRERDGFLEYYSLGDTVIILRMKDGEVMHILDERLVRLDNENFERMKKIAAEKGKTVRAAFADIVPYILENRRKMNTPQGYCALAHTTDGLDTALMGKIPLAKIRDLLVFSDGFAEIYDLFGLYPTPAALIAEIAENGIMPAMKRLHAAQEAARRHLRHLRRDLTIFGAPRLASERHALIF